MKVLIIHQNKELIKTLSTFLESKGHIIKNCSTFVEGLEKFYQEDFDLIIIDTIIMNIKGSLFCEKIRNKSNKVGLFAISNKKDEELKLEMLAKGIDDFIELSECKQIEIELRITNLIRRVLSSQIIKEDNYIFNNIKLDLFSRTLIKEGKIIKLSITEFLLLELLLKNKNQPLKREEIDKNVWKSNNEKNNLKNSSNKLEVYIRKLRLKIGDKSGKILQSVRGYGYVIKD